MARGSRDHPQMMKMMRNLIPGTVSKSQAVRMRVDQENKGGTKVMKRKMRVKSTWLRDLLSRMMRMSS